MRRSATNTRILIHASHVKKQGNERVGEQGRWLLATSAACMPRVYECAANWYTMERLHTVPLDIVDPLKMFLHIADKLEAVWSARAACALDYSAHIERARQLAMEFLDAKQGEKFSDLLTTANISRLTPRLSHGDPTFDNVMMRTGGDLVLIDPNPAVGSVGDLQEVDLAWMVMSLLNYEALRYGTEKNFDVSIHEVQAALRDVGCLTRDIVAVLYFTVFNALRAQRYIDQPERREAITRDIIDPILDLRL